MTSIHKYRKKPVVIEAIQLQVENSAAVKKWIEDNDWNCLWNAQSQMMSVQTLEGWITAWPGDFIIKGVKGEMYPCKPDIFAETYNFIESGANSRKIEKPQDGDLRDGAIEVEL